MIIAVMMVRNEADIIGANLAYHLSLGIDQILVADNGSTDRTVAILDRFAASGRVHVSRRPGPFLQAATTTELAHEAFRRGARWVLPIDADEFWHVPNGRLRDVLDDASDAGVLEAEVVNFVQSRSQYELSAEAVLTMTRRPAKPVGTSAEASGLVESGRIGFVEIHYPPKSISRASIALQIAQGNHSVTGADGPSRPITALVCLHAPLRARAALVSQKVEHGRRIDEVDQYLQLAWHVRRWRRLAEQGRIDPEWWANSYLDDYLDVYGARRPLATDTTLRDLVAPWIDANVTTVTVSSAAGDDEAGDSPVADLDPAAAAALLDRMEGIEGWFRRVEGELLLRVTRQAVAALQSPVIVEIGSYCGRSTVLLASAARTVNQAVRVYAIDPHDGEVGAADSREGVRNEVSTLLRFRANLDSAGVADAVVPIVQQSWEVSWQQPIALLLIDGLHDYESVARDFLHFEPYLSIGGYVAFHDCDERFPGVKSFAGSVATDPAYEEVGRSASLIVFRRRLAAVPEDAHDRQLAALRVRVAQLEKGVGFLSRELATREQTIREREEGIEWLRGVVRDRELTVAELEKGVEWLRNEVRERERTIETLRSHLEREGRQS